jgi:hypothetical protein
MGGYPGMGFTVVTVGDNKRPLSTGLTRALVLWSLSFELKCAGQFSWAGVLF